MRKLCGRRITVNADYGSHCLYVVVRAPEAGALVMGSCLKRALTDMVTRGKVIYNVAQGGVNLASRAQPEGDEHH